MAAAAVAVAAVAVAVTGVAVTGVAVAGVAVTAVAVGGGGDGGGGVGGAPFRVFVNVQTTTSPLVTSPSTFVPGTEAAIVPLRVHSTLES